MLDRARRRCDLHGLSCIKSLLTRLSFASFLENIRFFVWRSTDIAIVLPNESKFDCKLEVEATGDIGFLRSNDAT